MQAVGLAAEPKVGCRRGVVAGPPAPFAKLRLVGPLRNKYTGKIQMRLGASSVAELHEKERIIRRALRQFTAAVTVPIVYDGSRGVDQVGTGTLLTLANRYFLITARHLFEDCDPGRFAIPKGRVNADLHSLEPFSGS